MRSITFLCSAARRLAPASVVLLATTGAFAKQTPVDANLPQPVAAWLTQAQRDCPAGFQAQNPIQSVDSDRHRAAGYIADPHRLVCASEPHLFSGDGPASIELFVTLPSGEVVHTGGVRALAYQVMPSPQGGPPTLAFQTHESAERTGSVDNYRWDGHNFALLNKNSMARPPVDGRTGNISNKRNAAMTRSRIMAAFFHPYCLRRNALGTRSQPKRADNDNDCNHRNRQHPPHRAESHAGARLGRRFDRSMVR